MLAEEDRGPSWLRDYGNTNFGTIDADIAAMENFAKKLRADVETNYVPHLTSVTDKMLTKLPPAATTFPELVAFMQDHVQAQDATQSNVYGFADGTARFATVAQTISKEYAGSDAFAQARVGDVEDAFVASVTPTEATPDA
ncbi:hypothetical protein [Actinoplanes sp. NPDC049265]|uniref:hypothetical protein n=1 Tax=Actinoplanes sp. NPDC049265 TaxID=3363902 RepID=UPI00370F7EC5